MNYRVWVQIERENPDTDDDPVNVTEPLIALSTSSATDAHRFTHALLTLGRTAQAQDGEPDSTVEICDDEFAKEIGNE